jgi:hypothetical protein
MHDRTVRFVLPAIGATVHFAAILAIWWHSTAGNTGGWDWAFAFFLDFPVSIGLFPMCRLVPSVFVFGVFGSAWWYFLLWTIGRLVAGRRAQGSG